MGEGDEDVGEDDRGVGVDHGDDDGPRRCYGATGSEGERAPLFFFFLDLLPGWEKGFPSSPWSPWRGRGESPSVEDIATEYKPARRVRFTLDYVEAHEDPEDGALLKEA